MTRNRYLFISPDYPPPTVGGSLVYYYTLVENADQDFDILTAPLPRGLSEVSSPRHRVIRSRFLVPSIAPTNIQMLLMYLYLTWWALWIGITRRFSLVVFYTSAIGNGFFSLVFRLLRVKVVVVAFAEEITLAQRAPGLKGSLKRFFMNGYRWANGFVCICDYVKDLIVEMGVDKRKMCVIPTPICPSKTIVDTSRNGSGRVLTVGRLVRRKGFHLVIEAVHRLRQEIPHIHLVIVGDGEEMPRLVRQVADLDLGRHVTFTGMVTDDAVLARLYAECDVFVLANLLLEDGNTEGSPNVLIEASAQGKPVIAGIEGGTSTAVRDGVTGFLLDPRDVSALADRIKIILLDGDLARRLGEAGRRKVKEEHDPRKAGERFSSFLQYIEQMHAGLLDGGYSRS